MVKRYIRLKELPLNFRKFYVPSEQYYADRPRLTRGEAYLVRTDPSGYIRSGLSVPLEEHILLLGGSFVENIYLHECERIAAQLERKLLREGYAYKVFNGGVSGATSLNVANALINKVLFNSPKLVVIVTSSNDLSALRYRGGYYNQSRFHANVLPENDESWVYDSIEKNIYQYETCISMIESVCALAGTKLIWCTFPDTTHDGSICLINDILRKRAGSSALIDIDRELPKADGYYYDKLHLNAKGANSASDLILSKIKSVLIDSGSSLYNSISLNVKGSLDNKSSIWSDWVDNGGDGYRYFDINLKLSCGKIRKHKALVIQIFFEGADDKVIEGWTRSHSLGWHRYVDLTEECNLQLAEPLNVPAGLVRFKLGFRAYDQETIINVEKAILEISRFS